MAYELSLAIGRREVVGFHGILVNARIFIFTELGGYADRFTAASIVVIRRGGGAFWWRVRAGFPGFIGEFLGSVRSRDLR
jgi:hypothetical protein